MTVTESPAANCPDPLLVLEPVSDGLALSDGLAVSELPALAEVLDVSEAAAWSDGAVVGVTWSFGAVVDVVCAAAWPLALPLLAALDNGLSDVLGSVAMLVGDVDGAALGGLLVVRATKVGVGEELLSLPMMACTQKMNTANITISPMIGRAMRR